MRIAVRIVTIVTLEVSGIMAASGCVVDEAVAWGSASLSVRPSPTKLGWLRGICNTLQTRRMVDLRCRKRSYDYRIRKTD